MNFKKLVSLTLLICLTNAQLAQAGIIDTIKNNKGKSIAALIIAYILVVNYLSSKPHTPKGKQDKHNCKGDYCPNH